VDLEVVLLDDFLLLELQVQQGREMSVHQHPVLVDIMVVEVVVQVQLLQLQRVLLDHQVLLQVR
jgi:hypothetical protein